MTQRTVVANTDYEGTDQRYIELNCGHAAVVNPDEAPKEGESFDCIACPTTATPPAEPMTAKQARKAAAAKVTGATTPSEKAAGSGRIGAQRVAIYKLVSSFIENVLGTGLGAELGDKSQKSPQVKIVESQPNIMVRFQVGLDGDRHEYTIHLREIDPSRKV